jgi:heme exporter protein D
MNWAEFFAMDGRGFYVWGSFGAFLLCMVLEIVLVRLRIGRVQRELREEAIVAAMKLSRGSDALEGSRGTDTPVKLNSERT